MRTLALLAASLLLVLVAQAEPLRGRAQWDEPEMQGKAQSQVEVFSFPVEERSALQDAGVWRSNECTCRRPSCESGENQSGFCNINNVFFQLCCT